MMDGVNIGTGGGDYAERTIDKSVHTSVSPELLDLLKALVGYRDTDESRTEATLLTLKDMRSVLARVELVLLGVMVSQILLTTVLLVVLGIQLARWGVV